MQPTVANLETLLPEEKAEFRTLFDAWQSARTAKNWPEADRLRSQVAMWDAMLGADGLWHPAFEQNLNRQRRAVKRMKRYSVDVYPWTLVEAA